MDDESKFDLAQSRRQQLLRLKRLEELRQISLSDFCVMAIAEEITEFYMEREDRNIYALPFVLRYKLLRALWSTRINHDVSTEIMLKILTGLMTDKRTKEINLKDGCMSVFRNCTEAEFCLVLTQIKNIAKSLSILHFETNLGATDQMVDLISQMKSLQMIKITRQTLRFADVENICESLPLLRYLKLADIDLSNVDLQNRERIVRIFSHLKVFLYNDYQIDSEQIVDLKLSFTKYLTGLERVESMVDGDSDSSLCNYLNWRDDLELPMEVSQLRYLHAHATENELFHTRFPHVTHLTVFPNPNYGDANNQPIGSLEHFSHLESLRLVCGLREEYLQRLLNRHGANLRSLIIEQVEDQIVDLNFISARCQRLEVLDISTKFTISSKYLFPELKKLSLRCIEFDFDDIKLSFLLNIPNLEDLRIRDISIHTFDLDDLRGDCANMISNPPVLRQLEYLEISVWEDELLEDEIELARQYFKALSELVKNACTFLPKLLSVDLFVRMNGLPSASIQYDGRPNCDTRLLDYFEDPNLHRFVSLYYPR